MGLMKYGLSGRIMKEFIALIPKMCSYVTDDGYVDKKGKGHKEMCNKTQIYILRLQNFLEKNKAILK